MTESDEAFDALLRSLSHRRDRELLSVLESDETNLVDVDTLADRLAGDSDVDREQVKIDLHHRHLPRLDEADVIEYHPGRAVVEYTDSEAVSALLSVVGQEPEA